MPISTANRHGPSKSPKNLDTPSPFSANRDDHWETVSSHAPAQVITTSASRNLLSLRRDISGVRFSSGIVCAIGTNANHTALAIGTIAQTSGRTYHNDGSVNLMNRVESRTTTACPQQ